MLFRSDEFAERFQRDLRVMGFGETAREKRRQNAWEALKAGRDALW